jgi:hypothetical protein
MSEKSSEPCCFRYLVVRGYAPVPELMALQGFLSPRFIGRK